MKIYNSLTRKKTEFKPIRPFQIGLYVCGITVYDYSHIGHARPMIFFDIMVRYFRSQGYQVNYVRNITDIDDKIINRARENNEDWRTLADRFIAAMHEDDRALGIMPPDHEPRATEFIPQIITLIEKIMKKGYAYQAENGDVYFDVRRFESYGKLSQRNIDQLKSGVRIKIVKSKHDSLDFVLWKKSKPAEPSWESPWGVGRPGWHIECSAMASSLLGQPFDFHGGGMDLKFPHHENEIAQSEAACGCDFAKTWLHVGLVTVNGEKMSKSLGNFFTIRDVLAKHDAELLRYFMISSHYRSPLNYSEENLSQLRSGLERLYSALRGLPLVESKEEVEDYRSSAKSVELQFHQAMKDDFNTPVALSALFDLVHSIQRLKEQKAWGEAVYCGKVLRDLGGCLGILGRNPEEYFQGGEEAVDTDTIRFFIEQREQARLQKKWEEADRVRSKLFNMGILIEDTPSGTVWRRLKS